MPSGIWGLFMQYWGMKSSRSFSSFLEIDRSAFRPCSQNTKHRFDACTAHGSVLVALSQWTSSWCDLYDGQNVSACNALLASLQPLQLLSCQHCTDCFPKPCCQHCPNIAISSVPFSSQYNQLLTFQYFIQSTLLKNLLGKVLYWTEWKCQQISTKSQKKHKKCKKCSFPHSYELIFETWHAMGSLHQNPKRRKWDFWSD